MIGRMLAICGLVILPLTAMAQQDGQQPPAGSERTASAGANVEAAISTQLTSRSHSVGAFTSAYLLEGTACPSPTRMISGACHPGFNDRVIIINQFPNISANTWRCGFRNNNSVTRTVWVYTLCAQ